MKRKNVLLALTASCVAFLAVQTGAALLPSMPGVYPRIASETIRLFIVAGLLGTMIPIIIGRKIKLPYDRVVTTGRIFNGIALLAGALILEIIFFSSWFTILNTNPDDIIRIKHLLVTLPIAIALSLMFYFLLPETIERFLGTGPASRIITLIIPAGALGLVLYAETGFTHPAVFYVMTGVGFLAAAGHLLTDKFFLTFITIFLAVYANSLSQLRYDGFSWPVAIIGFIFCMSILIVGFYVRVGDADRDPESTGAAAA
jgi:hypothetical protein